MLAAATARQANSRTAQVVLLAGKFNQTARSDNALDQRILYFCSHKASALAAYGPFWTARRTQGTAQTKYESCVYQDGSMNNKAHDLSGGQNWKQFIQTGHGASRTI